MSSLLPEPAPSALYRSSGGGAAAEPALGCAVMPRQFSSVVLLFVSLAGECYTELSRVTLPRVVLFYSNVF